MWAPARKSVELMLLTNEEVERALDPQEAIAARDAMVSTGGITEPRFSGD